MKRALVTGGYGYIGGHLVESLVRDNWGINILDTLENKCGWKFSQNGGDRFVLRGSVVNPDAVARALYKCGVLFHLADRREVSLDPRVPARLFKTNVQGTATLLSKARMYGLDNVVVASSYEAYGNVVGAEEEGISSPVTSYGFSKVAMELVCRAFINLGMNIKILRIFSVWGGKYDTSVVTKFAKGEGSIRGSGSQTRDFVHVNDVITALKAATMWDAGMYNIGSGEEISIEGVWKILNPDKEPSYIIEAGERAVFRSVADLENVLSETGWKATTLLSQLNRAQLLEHLK